MGTKRSNTAPLDPAVGESPPLPRISAIERIHVGQQASQHQHSWNELVCPLRGRYEVILPGGSRHRSEPGSVFVYPAGQIHRPQWLGTGREPTDFFLVCWQGPLPEPRPPIHAVMPAERLHQC